MGNLNRTKCMHRSYRKKFMVLGLLEGTTNSVNDHRSHLNDRRFGTDKDN